jgi:hypothetical protein
MTELIEVNGRYLNARLGRTAKGLGPDDITRLRLRNDTCISCIEQAARVYDLVADEIQRLST